MLVEACPQTNCCLQCLYYSYVLLCSDVFFFCLIWLHQNHCSTKLRYDRKHLVVADLSRTRRFIGQIGMNLNPIPIFRRGEGGEEWLGGPSWSPVGRGGAFSPFIDK